MAVIIVAIRLSSIFTNSTLSLVTDYWYVIGISLFLIAVIDFLRSDDFKKIDIQREIYKNLALGDTTPATLTVHNKLSRSVTILLKEQHQEALEIEGLPVSFSLSSGTKKVIHYKVTPIKRGDSELKKSIARIHSKWKLWQHQIVMGENSSLKIYPNFTPISTIADLGVEQHIRKIGIHLSQRRGDGLEFKQLREFTEGDALRQIDWKASAKQHKPISREYQDERDQDVIFLLDCGRRLRHQEGNLSHFDHALNALLLTAYIATKQGDAVGVLSFSGSDRWIRPVKGKQGINILLNQMYDLQSSSHNSDFLKVAANFSKKHNKRSMVIIISNIREEDNEDIITASHLLRKKHKVVIASLRENLFDNITNKTVHNFNDALYFAGSQHFLNQQQQVLQKLTAPGITAINSTPQQLHLHLVNEYFRMKRNHSL